MWACNVVFIIIIIIQTLSDYQTALWYSYSRMKNVKMTNLVFWLTNLLDLVRAIFFLLFS